MRDTRWLLAPALLLAACESTGGPNPVPAASASTPAPVSTPFPRPSVLPPGIPASAWQLEQTVAVDLAVYQFQFLDTRLPWPPLYFVGLSAADMYPPWSDPSSDLMARFAGHQPAVRPVSRCRTAPLGPIGVADVETGEQGVAFLIGPRAWISETEVLVTGGYYCGGLCAEWHVYRIRYEGRRWAVVHVQPVWIA